MLAGSSIPKIAKTVGLSGPHVRMVCMGKRPSPRVIAEISRVIGVPAPLVQPTLATP